MTTIKLIQAAFCLLLLAPFLPAMAAEVTLEYIAHAAFNIHAPDGTAVLIDPYASRVWLGYDFPERYGREAAAVLITHPHYDHDGGEYRAGTPPWQPGLPVYRFPGRFEQGPFTFTGHKGRHVDPYGKEFGQFNTIWLIEVAGLRIVHLGDNALPDLETLRALGRVDVLLAPVDDLEHILTFADLDSIRDTLRPAIFVPMHYRVAELERAPDSPSDLGGIEKWLKDKKNLQRQPGNLLTIDREDLPNLALGTVVVFKPSPAIKRPE